MPLSACGAGFQLFPLELIQRWRLVDELARACGRCSQRVASVVAAFGASAEDRAECLRQLEVEVEAARSELLETVAAQAAELAQRMALKEQEMNTWVAAVPEEPRTEVCPECATG